MPLLSEKNYISQGLPPSKKAPSKLIEMQQAFSEQYYNIPPTNVQKKITKSLMQMRQKTPNNKDNNNNNNNNNLGTLGQIAPLFNVLSGGKKPANRQPYKCSRKWQYGYDKNDKCYGTFWRGSKFI